MPPDVVLRRSRNLAFAAFLLAATSLLLPWFTVTWDNGTTAVQESVRPFADHRPLTNVWGPWASGLLVGLACLVLFVRIAAAEYRHDPPKWQRAAGLVASLLAFGAAIAILWPEGVPSFWGGRTYSDPQVAGPATTETALPGIGWWLAIAAAVAMAGSWGLARAAQRLAGEPDDGP